MPQRDVEFKASDHVTFRSWLFTPNLSASKLPCLVMAHGWTSLKEMDLNTFAKYFTSHLSISSLVYDNRGFGASDAKEGEPRHEIIPAFPLANGWDNFHPLIRPDFVQGMSQAFADDRNGRLQGKEAVQIPVVDADPLKPSSLPTADSYNFFSEWEKKCDWKNEVTVKGFELLPANDPSHMISQISPTLLLMTVAENDVLAPTNIAIEASSRAREPKQLHIIPGGHFDGYSGANFEKTAGRQAEYLKTTLCA